MRKNDYLVLMKFPLEWFSWGMYPDELFEWQVSGYSPGHEDGSEHDRNGAFHWWLRRSPTQDELDKLLRLAALDPDPLLGNDVRKYIRQASNFNEKLSVLERELFENR